MKRSSKIITLVAIVFLVFMLVPHNVFADTKKADDGKADRNSVVASDKGTSEDSGENSGENSGEDSGEEEEVVDTRPDYIIRVNRCLNTVTIYEIDEGHGEKPVKAMACSTGKPWHPTAIGTFKTSDYYVWRLMCGDCYSQYAVRFNGKMLFHSVPYDRPTHDSLWSAQYNMLGEYASSGCVRLATIDAKWIYDNCKQGTKVVVYDNPNNPGPLGKPEPVRVDLKSPYKGWDPTDPDENNPWIAIEKEKQAKEEAARKEAEARKQAAIKKSEEWKKIRENIEGSQN